MCLADVFAVVGGALELIGLGLVVSEIRDTRRQVAELGALGERRQQIGTVFEFASTTPPASTAPAAARMTARRSASASCR
jgi:hypothetical protein